MVVFSFTSFGEELFLMGAGSLGPLSRDRCFACFSRRCLEVSGAKSRDIIEQCALRQREGYPCVKALGKRCGRVGISGFGIRLSAHVCSPAVFDVMVLRRPQASRANCVSMRYCYACDSLNRLLVSGDVSKGEERMKPPATRHPIPQEKESTSSMPES